MDLLREINVKTGTVVKEPLEKVVEHLEEEARMILPGIQALFGFQLIAVFNQRFSSLEASVQMAHFIALLASALSVLLILTPAAYHRQAETHQISERFCRVGTFCLTLSMLPLSLGMALDIFVIANVLNFSANASYALGFLTFTALFFAWFVFPRVMKSR